MALSLIDINFNLTEAFDSLLFNNLGSETKERPLTELGGVEPQMDSLSASMIVVLPDPFWPTMSVSGWKKSMMAISSGSYERRPVIPNRSILLIVYKVMAAYIIFYRSPFY